MKQECPDRGSCQHRMEIRGKGEELRGYVI